MAACWWLLAWVGLVFCSVTTASAQRPPARTDLAFPGAPGAPALQPFVAPGRIGLIGWSHGGITTLHAVDDIYLVGRDRFRAAIAFYPGCLIRLLRVNAPLLILIGEEDDWTSPARCRP